METRHPVEGSFSCEYPAISNRCGVMAAWSRKALKFCYKFLRFFGKRPLAVKFSKFCSVRFHRDTDRRRVQISWNWADGKSAKSCAIYQKQSPASQNVATARSAPKIGQGQPPTMYLECSRFHLNRFTTLGGVIAERVNTAKSRPKVNPIFGESLASSRIKMNCFLPKKYFVTADMLLPRIFAIRTRLRIHHSFCRQRFDSVKLIIIY